MPSDTLLNPKSGPSEKHPLNMIEVDDSIYSLAFLVDGEHVLGCGKARNIRRWRVEDGKEVGLPMDAGSAVRNIAVSKNGKWVVGGTNSGQVMVWNAESHEKVTEFEAHSTWVRAIDVSPCATKIATGSDERNVYIWSFSSGKRKLLGSLLHDGNLAAVKFSPDGHFIATAMCDRNSIRIYDTYQGRLVVHFPIQVCSPRNQSLAWASDNKELFVLSRNGTIYCLDVRTGQTLSQWPIHSSNNPTCIALASNDTFIAASTNSSVSFWDTITYKQIGSIIDHNFHAISSMAISSKYLAIGGNTAIAVRELRDILPSHYFGDILPYHYFDDTRTETEPEEAIQSLCTQLESSDGQVAYLEDTVQQLRTQFAESQRRAAQERVNSIQILRAQEESSSIKIAELEETIQQLRAEFAKSQRRVDQMDTLIQILQKKHQCEALYVQGHIVDAAQSLLEILNTVSDDVRADKVMMDWLAEFKEQCLSTLERVGDEASSAQKCGEALAAYATALLLGPSTQKTVLTKWVSTMLICDSTHEVSCAAAKFKVPMFVIYREICDTLETVGRVTEAIKYFRQMQSELRKDTNMQDERAEWEHDLCNRCIEKLENLGDAAMHSKDFDAAVERYSEALALDAKNRSGILLKRSKVRSIMNLWDDALSDAEKVIELGPSSHKGYERKYATLHGMGRHSEAFRAFRMMFSKLEESLDPHIQELRHQYVDATPAIQKVIEQTISHMPRVLIDTATGNLYDKTQQAAAFEELPIYDELRSSMTTRLDRARIRKEVKKFYRYVMLSHRWQHHEPSFQQVETISVYELPASPANSKLHNFCKLVQILQFRWAWSDTCCVNQLDRGVQQESSVAMFRWYRGSSLTVVHLLGVFSHSQEIGCLWRSIWNTRGWTYQEYVASEVVQFYTEDWKPYLGLDIFNHKESPIILQEMEHAMNFTTQQLATLQPGLHTVREKLYLASRRQTTREEDMAYSLFGIFNVAIPVIYGEGDHAVGRLLEHVLVGSGDVTILTWTGISGSYNSCFPVDLTVYSQIVPPHIPRPIETTEMDRMVMNLRSSSLDLSLAAMLSNRLHELPSPFIAASRLRLAGIVFPLTHLTPVSDVSSESGADVYHGSAPALGDVEIRTTDKLEMQDLLLIHPWTSALLDQEFSHGAADLDATTRALRLIVRLRQPFGSLLLAPLSRVQFRRVATDSLIMVRVREDLTLTELMDSIRTVDIQ